MADDRKLPSAPASRAEVDAFLRKVALTPATPGTDRRGRLIFAMDATSSREARWDQASHIQAEMFVATTALGGLEVQLAYYRGFREFKAAPWVSEARQMLARMTRVYCLAGNTQIARVLTHAIKETKENKVDALVFVGDCLEEDLDRLGHMAGQLGLLGVPCFMFHEGHDQIAARGFQQIARLSGGAFCRFDANSADQLKELLSAVAVYAAGGRKALSDFSSRRGGMVPKLTHQLK